jgi:hypothetical protein
VETKVGNGCLSALSACAWAPSSEAMLVLEVEKVSKPFEELEALFSMPP